MQLSDKPELSKKLAVVMSAYGKHISDALVEVFFLTLKQYDLDAIDAALVAHVANPDTGQYPPKPADVVRLIDGGTGDRALRAWSMVDRAIRQVGPNASLAFPCPITHRIIDDMGGWERLCNTPSDDELKFVGIEFQKRYRASLLHGGPGTDYPAYLIGHAEAFNRAHGRPHRMELVLVGRDERAKAIALQVSQGGNRPQLGNDNPIGNAIKRLTAPKHDLDP